MSTTIEELDGPKDDEESQRLLKRTASARDLSQPASPAADGIPTVSRITTADEVVASLKGGASGPKQGLLDRWKARGGVLGTIATALIFLLKVAAPALFLLGKIKIFLLAGGSMLLSIWLESKLFGWPLAAGIVILIFIHECGHALAARLRGIPTGIMVFIPFMGAFVTTKRYGKNLEEDAFIGIMGPVVGSIASAVVCSFYLVDHNRFWLVLGQFGLFINLFNLLPTAPLDGGWIAPLFSPKLLAVGLVIAIIVGFKNPLIWLLLLMSAPRIMAGWRADPRTQPYYRVSADAKWKYGFAYFGLIAFLALGSGAITVLMLA